MVPSRPPLSNTLSSVNITFLGTASAQPSSTRNHSSLALRLGGDVWLFDCGEATQHQIQKSTVKAGKIKKIFITHTHGEPFDRFNRLAFALSPPVEHAGDHIFGLLPLLCSRLNGAGGAVEDAQDPRLREDPARWQDPLEIYGPLGTRAYVRNGLAYTYSLLEHPYVVHELRFTHDPPEGDYTALPRHRSESPNGRNIIQVDGVWPDIYKDPLVSVSAAPILHSIPSVGFVILEAPVPGKMDPKKYIPALKRTKTPMSTMSRLQQGDSVELSDGTVLHGPARRPGRKVVILGDTHDPSPISGLAADADLLIHEATNAHLPGIDSNTKDDDTFESVEARTKSRGHSTPQMAGTFAKRVGAKKLVLNHFSARYAGNDHVDEEARTVMMAIKNLAMQEFGGEVICARDFMSLDIELRNEPAEV